MVEVTNPDLFLLFICRLLYSWLEYIVFSVAACFNTGCLNNKQKSTIINSEVTLPYNNSCL